MEVGVKKGELLKSYSVHFYTIIVQKTSEDKSPVGPYLLAFFIFVVCGSGKCLKRICVRVCVCVISYVPMRRWGFYRMYNVHLEFSLLPFPVPLTLTPFLSGNKASRSMGEDWQEVDIIDEGVSIVCWGTASACYQQLHGP